MERAAKSGSSASEPLPGRIPICGSRAEASSVVDPGKKESMSGSGGAGGSSIEVLGIPMDLDQDRRRMDVGPSAIRYARLSDVLEGLGYAVSDLGNVGVPIPEMIEAGGAENKGMPHLRSIREVCERTAAAAHDVVAGGAFPIFLGGDHSVSIGTVSGMAVAGRTGVVWVDAHADFNTPETSPSGNIHGMPLATLTGRGHPDLVRVGGERERRGRRHDRAAQRGPGGAEDPGGGRRRRLHDKRGGRVRDRRRRREDRGAPLAPRSRAHLLRSGRDGSGHRPRGGNARAWWADLPGGPSPHGARQRDRQDHLPRPCRGR